MCGDFDHRLRHGKSGEVNCLLLCRNELDFELLRSLSWHLRKNSFFAVRLEGMAHPGNIEIGAEFIGVKI
jgi:hypothetical protein